MECPREHVLALSEEEPQFSNYSSGMMAQMLNLRRIHPSANFSQLSQVGRRRTANFATRSCKQASPGDNLTAGPCEGASILTSAEQGDTDSLSRTLFYRLDARETVKLGSGEAR